HVPWMRRVRQRRLFGLLSLQRRRYLRLLPAEVLELARLLLAPRRRALQAVRRGVVRPVAAERSRQRRAGARKPRQKPALGSPLAQTGRTARVVLRGRGLWQDRLKRLS